MKIRTQLIISVVLFSIALLIIVASIAQTNQQVDRLKAQEELANNIILGATDLRVLSNDYLLYNESQQLDRWNTKYAEFSDYVSHLSVNTPEQQALVNSIKADQQQLKEILDNVVSSRNTEDLMTNSWEEKAFIQLSSSRLAVQNREIVFDASSLYQLLLNQESHAKQTNNLIIMTMLGVFGAFVLALFFLIFGSTIKSIGNLKAGAKIIGSGNLNYKIKVNKRDEVSELADEFNQMTARLKTVTASKADLEHEITERKLAEDELKSAKAQAELYLDLMGHDINNMHQIALGYLELSKELQADCGQAEYLDKSMEVLQRSTQLIKNVRKLQKIKEGVFQTQVVDVSTVLVEVVREFGSVPGKAITLNLNGHKYCHVRANELLHDVFANLVSNAIKHTGDRADIGVKLDIVGNDGCRYCRVMVEDNGPGIQDEFKGKLFNRMLKDDTKTKGMGLGLYLVKSLVDSYGGRVWVEDRVPGDHTKGARFVIVLPAA